MSIDNLMVFTGNANPRSRSEVVRHLNIHARHGHGRPIFSDGEVMVEILENVRGKDVFVLQSTCSPTNDNLMELLVMVDALKRASAGRITAVIPYFGYARQDRRPRSARVAITAKVVANMMQRRGRGPGADDGSACRPDPGLLRHPGGQHLRRRRCCWATCGSRRYDESDRGVAGRRRRGAGPRDGQAAGTRPRDHRQAPPASRTRRR